MTSPSTTTISALSDTYKLNWAHVSELLRAAGIQPVMQVGRVKVYGPDAAPVVAAERVAIDRRKAEPDFEKKRSQRMLAARAAKRRAAAQAAVISPDLTGAILRMQVTLDLILEAVTRPNAALLGGADD